MLNRTVLLTLGLILVVALFGCSGDTAGPTENEQSNPNTLVRGEIDGGGAAFEYTIEAADPLIGPFVLRGNNIHYVDSLSALSVDFTIENQGEVAHIEPIGLTFTKFFPNGVTVENPDNDETGAGAAIMFEFDNDDGKWAPGETSLPRMVAFGVSAEESFGFIAHVDIPQDTTRGTIGGIVYHDINENGEIDADEPGIGGMIVYLVSGDDPTVEPTNAAARWRTTTARDGSYRFEDLDAGYYQVIREFRDPSWTPTTSTVISVVLVEYEGDVKDFLEADFGCIPGDVPPPSEDKLEVGDYVHVNGNFVDDPDYAIVARSIEVLKCTVEPPPDSLLALASLNFGDRDDHDWDGDCDGDNDWDHDDWDGCDKAPCWGLKNELFGPVTDIDRDGCAIEVMGSWVHFAMNDTTPNDTIPSASDGFRDGSGCFAWRWLDLEDVEVGDMVRVRVIRHPGDGMLYGYRLKEWGGTPEKVYGKVDRLSETDGRVEAIAVLGVKVEVTADTDIHFWRKR
jgi:hypothetical protein